LKIGSHIVWSIASHGINQPVLCCP